MQFVDTHCHLDYSSYQDDIAEVIQRAFDVGVQKIIVPGLNLDSSRQAVLLADRFPGVFAAIGVHPGDIDDFSTDQISQFEDLIKNAKVIAIGEIGLDLYHRQDNLNLQIEVLSIFLEFARSHRKPVILHSRDSLGLLFERIASQTADKPGHPLRGIFHAFEGNLTEAQHAVGMGFFLGAGGPVTYKNSIKKHEVFSKIDLSNIVLETDGPFLSPHLYRGKRNEPSYIPSIAQKIADLQHCDITEVAYTTTRNISTLLNWT